jgi:hypothetical protein
MSGWPCHSTHSAHCHIVMPFSAPRLKYWYTSSASLADSGLEPSAVRADANTSS